MTTTKLSNMTSSVRMLTRVMNAADVNKDGALGTDEIKRIGIRDNFLTRNTVNKAIRTAAFGNDDVTIDQTVGALEQSVRSATRADKNGDKALSPAEAKKASILARQLQKFTDLNGDKTLADFKVTPREEPGTAAYAKLTQKEYQETLDLFGRPQFGTAMMLELSEVPSKARAKIAAMAAANPDGGRQPELRQRLRG